MDFPVAPSVNSPPSVNSSPSVNSPSTVDSPPVVNPTPAETPAAAAPPEGFIDRPGHPGGRPPPPPKPTFPPFPAGPYVGGYFVGGDGGNYFQSGGISGALISKLGLWRAPGNGSLTGIRVTYTNQHQDEFGTELGDYAEIKFHPGEKVTSMKLWGNGVGTRCGRVELHTDNNQTFEWGQNTDRQTAYVPPLGSGLLVGVAGAAGSEIDLLGFVFLREVASVTITNLNYATNPVGTSQGLSPVALQEASYAWGGQKYTYNFSGSVIRKDMTAWSSSNAQQFGIEVNVGYTIIPEILMVGGKFTWNGTWTNGTSGSVENDVTLSWGVNGSINGPADASRCTAVAQQGVLNIPYTATVVVKMKDGTSWLFKDNGTFHTVLYSSVQVTTKKATRKTTMDMPASPKDAMSDGLVEGVEDLQLEPSELKVGPAVTVEDVPGKVSV